MIFCMIRHFFLFFMVCATLPCSAVIPMFEENFTATDGRLITGDEQLEAGLYLRAIDAYRDVAADGVDLQTKMQARYRLGLALISQEDYDQAIEPLKANLEFAESQPDNLKTVRGYSIYLLALAYKGLHRYAEAKELLLSSSTALTNFRDEAAFELGDIYFKLREYEEARNVFQTLATGTQEKPSLQLLATIYLARVSLAEGHPGDATTRLIGLSKNVSPQDPFSFELAYFLGEAASMQQDYHQAIAYFKTATAAEKSSWYVEAMYRLGWSYLKISEDFTKSRQERLAYLKNAEDAFQKAVLQGNQSMREKGSLALAQTYLSEITVGDDSTAYLKAEALLSQTELFQSRDAQAHALLLRAEAAPTYPMRDAFYRQLTQEAAPKPQSTFYVTGWYMRGLNDMEYGDKLEASGDKSQAVAAYKRAADAFSHVFILSSQMAFSEIPAGTLKYQVIATGHFNVQEAWRLLDSKLIPEIQVQNDQVVQDSDELLYLHGYYAAKLAETDKHYLPIAVQSLKNAAAVKSAKFGDIALNHLGGVYYRDADYKNAETVYLQLATAYPKSTLAGEAWYWAACCAELMGKDSDVVKQRKKHVFEHYATSPYSAEAYFTFYPYEEYLQGDKNAMKHLQGFEEKYDRTPFLIESYYLLGLDYKRDRKTPEGKWIRKKSLIDAIDAFQQVETTFDNLLEKGLIPPGKTEYYSALRYRAMLERAMANLAIAEEAQGAKKKIYLDYAEEVFLGLLKVHSSTPQIPIAVDESTFGLAQTYIRAGKDQKADDVLSGLILNKTDSAKGSRYYQARAWDEKGRIALRRKDYLEALKDFKQAEEISKGGVLKDCTQLNCAQSLSTDQRLDLWIQQSLCCRALGRFDDAILTLSKVVNDDAVSSLRLKAMFLRAETYEIQGRPELARKQLESMVKKGGVWAQKAKEKLETNYGY
ncbi:MAG: tetratricopeptide repeat protein [Parachlamydiaceae bacterium]